MSASCTKSGRIIIVSLFLKLFLCMPKLPAAMYFHSVINNIIWEGGACKHSYYTSETVNLIFS